MLEQMGQALFYPPNVAGWPGGANWLTSDTMIARQNFLKRMLNSQTLAASSWLRDLPMHPQSATPQLVSAILQGDAAPASSARARGLPGRRGNVGAGRLDPGELRAARQRRRLSRRWRCRRIS